MTRGQLYNYQGYWTHRQGRSHTCSTVWVYTNPPLQWLILSMKLLHTEYAQINSHANDNLITGHFSYFRIGWWFYIKSCSQCYKLYLRIAFTWLKHLLFKYPRTRYYLSATSKFIWMARCLHGHATFEILAKFLFILLHLLSFLTMNLVC